MKAIWAHRSRWLCAWGLVGLLVAAGIAQAQAVPAPQLKSQTTIAGGDVASSWSVGGETVRLAGSAGLKPLLKFRVKGGGAWFTTLGVNLSTVEPGGGERHTVASSSVQRYASSGRSVNAEALAAGFTPAQAAAADAALGVPRPSPTATRASASSSVLDSACAKVTGVDATGEECMLIRLLSASGENWRLGIVIYTNALPAASHELMQLAGYSTSSSTTSKTAPTSTVRVTRCTPEAASIPGTGLSTVAAICPTTWGPYPSTGTAAGSIWQGCAGEGADEHAPSVRAITEPDGADDTIGMDMLMAGGGC
jgi:hypothetical protein